MFYNLHALAMGVKIQSYTWHYQAAKSNLTYCWMASEKIILFMRVKDYLYRKQHLSSTGASSGYREYHLVPFLWKPSMNCYNLCTIDPTYSFHNKVFQAFTLPFLVFNWVNGEKKYLRYFWFFKHRNNFFRFVVKATDYKYEMLEFKGTNF